MRKRARAVMVRSRSVSSPGRQFSRLVASGLGEGRDFASLILLAARDAGITIEPEED